MTNAEKLTLAKHACHIRMGVIEGTHSAKCGHPGGSLDIAEVLSYLYFVDMNVDPKAPKKPDRDRLVLSKGHAAPALYAALAERGFFPVEDLKTLRKIGSYLQGHPNMNETPGVDMSTGSLGQGVSAACGMALGAKISEKPVNVYTILGDGEVEEGECWEAFMFAAHYKLSNLCVMLDRNHLQLALFHLTVTEDGVDIDGLAAVLCAQRHAAGGRHALTQTAGGHIHARSLIHVGVALQVAADLAQGLEVFHREEPALGQRGVKCRSRMALGQHEAVAVRFFRLLGVDIHIHEVEIRQHLGDVQTAARMAALGAVSSLDHAHADVTGVLGKGKLFCICHDGPPV